MQHTAPADVINHLAQIAPKSAQDAMRDERPEAKHYAQEGFLALFAPEDARDFSLVERFALAVFVARLHGSGNASAFYANGLAAHDAPQTLMDAVAKAAHDNAAQGPYGAYPSGPLSQEDVPGPEYAQTPETARDLGPRLAAAFAHTHMLVFHPRDARAASLQTLLDAGWSAPGIVSLSQLVAFLAYQLRTVHGLQTLARCGAPGETS